MIERQVGDIIVLRATGPLIAAEVDALELAIRRHVADGNRRLVINLVDSERLDQAGLGLLVRTFVHYRGQAGRMVVCGLSKRIRDVFSITKLTTVMHPFETEQEAIDSFRDDGDATAGPPAPRPRTDPPGSASAQPPPPEP